MSDQLNPIDVLGVDRMIRRSYESATSINPKLTDELHDAEYKAALKAIERNINIGELK